MIRVLDQHTIDKIAAGEVIERPASVVKELVENSIDAGATRLTVEIQDGGTSMIRVTDNGSGIEESDVRKAYLSHATSKLDSVDDLLNVTSLGFRGEALSTIAAVAKVEMITKTHESLSGIKYVIHGGKEMEYKEVGAPDGTTIIARDLFFNTPARLKFLKSNMTEGSYINDLMSHIALSNPDISIKLLSGGKTIVDTQGDGRLRETIYTLYGKDITKGLLEVNYEADDIKITGYIGKPYLSKGNRSFENYFVNKRYIKSAVVNRAIEEAYKTYIMQHKFPFTAFFIEVPPYMVDVNVHPAKREFRFDNEKALFSAVYHAVADALAKKEIIPDAEVDYGFRQKTYVPPKTDQKQAITSSNIENETLVPGTDVSNRINISSAEKIENETLVPGTDVSNHINISSNENAENVEQVSASENNSYEAEDREPESDFRETHEFNSANSDVKISSSNIVNKTDLSSNKSTNSSSNITHVNINKSGQNSFSILESLLPEEYRKKISAAPESEKVSYNQEELTETRYLSESAKPDHKIIGLVFDTYWITEYDGCLYLMDQHAAHEKVNYETFLKEFKNRTIHSQNIFPPLMINLSSREKVAVMSHTDYLSKTGFEVEDFGGNDVKLSAVPANLLGLDSREVFMELAAYLTDEITGLTEDIFVRKLASMGCKAAVKGNQKITEDEVKILMERLMSLDNPYTCPHGRPTIIKVSKADLDKKFKRIVE